MPLATISVYIHLTTQAQQSTGQQDVQFSGPCFGKNKARLWHADVDSIL